VKILISSGANVNLASGDGFTALHSACSSDFDIPGRGADTVRILLNAGADVKKKDGLGMTPLHWAAFNGHEQMAKVLLEYRAPLNIKENNGYTPAGMAEMKRFNKLAEMLKPQFGLGGLFGKRK
jgi:ankyrin repeat protein